MADTHDNIISDADIASFEHDGVLCLRNVISPKDIQRLQRAVDLQVSEFGSSDTAYDFQSLAQDFFSDDPLDVSATRFDLEYFRSAIHEDALARPLRDERPAESKEGKFFYQAAGWLSSEDIRRVALDSNLVPLAHKLMRTQYTNFWEDTTFVKEAGATNRTAFHCDYGYFQISGEKCIIVWIPLDKTDEKTGSLEVVKGSHAWNVDVRPNLFFAQTPLPGTSGERLPDIEQYPEAFEIERYDCEPGDIVICHVRTIHGAGGNTSASRSRRAMSFRYTGDDIRYHAKEGALPQNWLSHNLSDGDQLFHPDYPLVWPRLHPKTSLTEQYHDYY